MVISNYLIISLSVSLFYCIGLLLFLTNYEENKCELTYMFEYPQFTKISLDTYLNYPQYALFAYSEGKQTEKVRAMRFNGIPVLFVPGNAGSYKQVRSLASVALRKAISSHSRYHFDFFTIDLNNELSGLNGAVLTHQTNFLNISLHRVLELYDKSKGNNPKSVIVVGHSMGGIIARGLMIDPAYTDNIELLITLATPHKRQAMYLDHFGANYYENIHKNHLSNYLEDKTFISIAGGNNDHLVHTHLTQSNFSSLNIVSTGIPKVWLTMDHACIMWCKQFVIAMIKSLFDCIDVQTKQLSPDHNYRMAVFKHHFLKNSGTSIRTPVKYETTFKFSEKGEWREDLRRQYTIKLQNGLNNINVYMVRLLNDPKHQSLHIQATNLESDWIYACSAAYVRGTSRVCLDGYHLSHLTEIIPSTRHKRRMFHVDLFNLKKQYPEITHVVVQVAFTQKPVTINFDVHSPSDRATSIVLPRWFSFSKTPIIKQTDPGALHYEIEILGLQHVIQSYMLYVQSTQCASYHAIAKLHVPWAHNDINVVFTEINNKPMLINLYSSRPSSDNSTAKVYLTLDPSCQFTISIQNSFMGMITQFARIYSPLLIVNVVAVILMTFRSQLNYLEETEKCSLFQSALSMSTKPYYLVTLAKLLSRLLSWNKLPDFIPTPDVQILIDENLDFLILPLLLYVISVGLTYMFSIILWGFLVLSETTVHRFVARFLMRTVGGAVKWSDWLINALHRVPCVVALTLLSLGMVTCTQLSLCLGAAYYFLKLTQMCQDYIESLMYIYMKNFIRKFSRIFKKSRKNDNQDVVTNEQNEASDDAVIEPKDDILEIESNVNDTDNTKESELRLRKTAKTTEQKDCGEKTDVVTEKETEDDKTNKGRNKQITIRESESSETEDTTEENKVAIAEENDHNDDEHEGKTREYISADSAVHFHFTLFLLWLLVALLNTPAVFTWAHSFPFYRNKPTDVFVPGLILNICAIPLWQMEMPRTDKLYYKELAAFIYMMTVLCLIYTPISLYRLTYILTATIAVVILHQLLAPIKPDDNDTDANNDTLGDEKDPVNLFNDIKTKLE